MLVRKNIALLLFIFLVPVFVVGCKGVENLEIAAPQATDLEPRVTQTLNPQTLLASLTVTSVSAVHTPVSNQPTLMPSPTALSTGTMSPTPTSTEEEVIFEVGEEITIKYLQGLEISGSEIIFEEQLADRSNYHQYLVSYISEGNNIFGLLTIPF